MLLKVTDSVIDFINLMKYIFLPSETFIDRIKNEHIKKV